MSWHPDYQPYGSTGVRIFPNRSAKWSAVTGDILHSDAMGVTLQYPNPLNERYTVISIFPHTTIDRTEVSSRWNQEAADRLDAEDARAIEKYAKRRAHERSEAMVDELLKRVIDREEGDE